MYFENSAAIRLPLAEIHFRFQQFNQFVQRYKVGVIALAVNLLVISNLLCICSPFLQKNRHLTLAVASHFQNSLE